jgi:proteasome lid subunit RPN8/RPN11
LHRSGGAGAQCRIRIRPRGFEIDPVKPCCAPHRNVRAQGRHVIGHYHSHPNGRAEPSRPRDAARAVENGQIWLIIANDSVAGLGRLCRRMPNTQGLCMAAFRPCTLVPV